MSNVIRLPSQRDALDFFSDNSIEDVEHLMHFLARGERVEYTGEMVQEHLKTGGKRLRARLALAAVTGLGGDYESAVAWAASVELLHNATLIHDDIQDGDQIRRGRPTTWVVHGQAQAINAGDLMLMLPFLALSNMNVPDTARWRLSWCLADQAAKTVRGQVEELALLDNQEITQEAYFRSIQGKTGGFFALPIEGAALIAGCSEKESRALGECFSELGILFQLQDDILDLYGDKGRGIQGADILEGKPSILVLRYLELFPEKSSMVWDILSKPREQTTQEEVDLLIRVFREDGALERALNDIRTTKNRILGFSKVSQYPILERILHILVNRVLSPIACLL